MPQTPEIIANVDGGSRGNPGPAAYGVTIKTAQGEPVAKFAKYLGRTTNNFAEYHGLLAALDFALGHGYPRLRVLTDSQLMARQISGEYKVRSLDLQPLYNQARSLIARLESFAIRHVYREQNSEADRLANEAMDDAQSGRKPRNPPPVPAASAPIVPSGQPSIDEPARTPAPLAAASAVPSPSTNFSPKPLVVTATFRDGKLHPHTQLPLFDGDELELEIRRKK